MGCDIHLHVEIKVSGKWLHYDHPRINRNYALFSKMANVRNDIQNPIVPIASPRGLPSDATESTLYDADFWKEDGHTHSYLQGKEIVTLFTWLREYIGPEKAWKLEMEEWGYLFGNTYDGFYKYPKDYPANLEDIRFIFWFDN